MFQTYNTKITYLRRPAVHMLDEIRVEGILHEGILQIDNSTHRPNILLLFNLHYFLKIKFDFFNVLLYSISFFVIRIIWFYTEQIFISITHMGESIFKNSLHQVDSLISWTIFIKCFNFICF